MGLCLNHSLESQCTSMPAAYPPYQGWLKNGTLGNLGDVNCGDPGVTLVLCPEVMDSYSTLAEGPEREK